MLTSLYVWLSSRNPFWFALAYLCALFAWALAYDLMPFGSFYAPYARYERHGVNDEYEIGLILQAAIRRKAEESVKQVPLDAVWNWGSPTAYVSRFTAVDNRNISFDLLIQLRRAGYGICQLAYWGKTTVESFALIDSTDPEASRGSFDHAEWKIDLAPDFTGLPRDNCGVTPPVPSEKLIEELSSINITMTEFGKIEIYRSGVTGDPLAISGSFGRMVYFSSVVITTVGFGDVVPISGLSRCLVALEAISGLLLFGLFLNAVASRAANLRGQG
jgi:hypothetical protein